MEITSKQRAKLKSLGHSLETIAQFGKGELTPEQITMINQVLKKRELIKCATLENSPYTARELAEMLAKETSSVAVQAIGRKFILYKRNEENPVITLD